MSELVAWHVYTGEEFNKLTKGRVFVRLTVENENHNGFQYKTGLNVDHLPFNPNSACEPGGLYFCDFMNFAIFIDYNDKNCKNLRYVTIPDNANIYIESLWGIIKYKTDRFILGPPKIILDDPYLCVEAIKQYPHLLTK